MGDLTEMLKGTLEGCVLEIIAREERAVQVTKRPSGVGPPRKFYALNDTGREELAKLWAKWQYVSSRIDKLKEGGR
ncbi:PadR family transcriptional regulator [Streptomyces sp. NBC_01264]|uniref:PadR family transcriptional regulator n=1 Tax=Streptomyces sp. NBC_01264 TaxID=2903804 RepID=UPI0022592CB4|nr:PadR family transcriptional regulator [Streptomyces sp. NBC_01264]MCX4782719.1 PadR family transcriptional regulator [Streptomyces sp. NBC_01264]